MRVVAKLKKDRRGFTLVELIVVLVILAILAAILVPALTGYIDKADERKVIAECRNALGAAQTIFTEDYAKGINYGSLAVSTEKFNDIKKLSEVQGRVYQIEADSTNTILHLYYSNSTHICIYCRYPESCTESPAHTKTYTVMRNDSPLNTPYVYYLTDENGNLMAMTAQGTLEDAQGSISSTQRINMSGNVYYLDEAVGDYEPGYYLFRGTAPLEGRLTLEENLNRLAGWNNVHRVNLDAPAEVYQYTRGQKNQMVVGNVYLIQRPQDPEPIYAVYHSNGYTYGTVRNVNYDLTATNNPVWKPL